MDSNDDHISNWYGYHNREHSLTETDDLNLKYETQNNNSLLKNRKLLNTLCKMKIIKNPKCQYVMLKLLQPGFKITNEQLQLLLQHLVQDVKKLKASDDDPSTIVIKDDDDEEGCLFIFSWLNKAFDFWESTGSISPNGFWFLSNLTTFLCKNEHIFIQLNKQGILTKMLKLSRMDKNPEYFDGELSYYCKLFSLFLNHKSGFDWVVSHNLTDKVISLALNSENPKIFKECCEFIASVLETSVENSEIICKSIMKKLIVPVFIHMEDILKDNTKEIVISEQIIVHLNLLIGILEKSLELCCLRNSFKIFEFLQEKFSFNKYMKNLKSLSKNENLVLEVDSLLVLLIFFELAITLRSSLEIGERKEKVHKCFYELTCISKEKEKLFYNFKLCYKALAYFQQIRHLLPKNSCLGAEEAIKFEIQLVALQVVPVLISLHIALDLECENLIAEDELREELFFRILKKLTELTLRLIMTFKQRRSQISINDGITALLYIKKSKDLYSKTAGNYLIQALMFVLGDIINAMKISPEKCGNLTEDFLSNLFDAIILFVEEFHVNWPDGIKSLCLTEMMYTFLSFRISSEKLIAKGLQLLNIAVSRHMSPTLALLLDDSDVTLIDSIGSILLEKLSHQNKEIRINALELIYTIALNSKTKFPSFRKTLQDKNFPYIVFTVATNDTESSVRAAASKCLQQMLQIDPIRKAVLNITNICDQLIQILYLDEDVFVRTETLNVITAIYDLDTTETISEHFCDIISHVMFADTETSLKIKSLDFWHKVIDVSFRRQGITDGQFPDATFSKQLKRIIRFDRETINYSLNIILSDLSQNGCLAIFYHVFKSECDLDLCNVTEDCFKDLIALLRKHEIIRSTDDTMDYMNSFDSLPPSTDDSTESLSPPLSPVTFISEFESINVQELDILINCECSAPFLINSDSMLKGREIVRPNDFLKFVYSEYETCYAEIKRKICHENSLDMLLDHIHIIKGNVI